MIGKTEITDHDVGRAVRQTIHGSLTSVEMRGTIVAVLRKNDKGRATKIRVLTSNGGEIDFNVGTRGFELDWA